MTTGRKPVSCEREARARAGMPGRSPRTTAWYSGSTASTAYAYRPADAAEPDAPRDLPSSSVQMLPAAFGDSVLVSQVSTRLSAGGTRIRTLGPPRGKLRYET